MIKGFKGYNNKLQCTPTGKVFQFEIGKEYNENTAKLCEKGFHFCENPLDIFNYYSPATSRFTEVEGDGIIDRQLNSDSKIATSQIRIGAEIGFPGLIKAGVEYIKSKVDWDNAPASNTGYQSAASVSGKDSIACALGMESKASGAIGYWIVLTEWVVNCGERSLKAVKTFKVDGLKIKADTYYTLKNGKAVLTE